MKRALWLFVFCSIPAHALDLAAIPSPQILPYTATQHYRDPAAVYQEGVFHLFFTVNEARDGETRVASFLGKSTSRDLVHWSEVRLLTPEDPALNYSSPGNIIRFQDEWVMCLQTYPIPDKGFIGDDTARLFIMRSPDLETWSPPELLMVKGPQVPREAMGRMIDPYLLEDKDEPGKWWCFYKQNGVSMSHSRDLRHWTYAGRRNAGENVCVLMRDNAYYMIHSPGKDGMGLLRSNDLKKWEPVLDRNITLGYGVWPWAQCRLTAGFALDLTAAPDVGAYLMFYHATASCEPHEHLGGCSIGVAWSQDLMKWHWPGE